MIVLSILFKEFYFILFNHIPTWCFSPGQAPGSPEVALQHRGPGPNPRPLPLPLPVLVTSFQDQLQLQVLGLAP